MKYKKDGRWVKVKNFDEIPENVEEVEFLGKIYGKNIRKMFILTIGYSTSNGETGIKGYLIGTVDKNNKFELCRIDTNGEKKSVQIRTYFKNIGG